MKTHLTNILDEIDLHGEEKVRKDLLTFSCPVNPSIENFFRLTHKAVLISSSNLITPSTNKFNYIPFH